jgi:signal transduction histidine kinase
MKRVSQRAAHYIRDELLKREHFIVIAVDSSQKILSVNRSTPDWNLPGLIRGSVLPDSLGSILSAAGGAGEPMVFPYVELEEFFVDIHVLSDETSADLVIHDVTETHENEQVLQQRAHENSLLSEQRAMLNSELAELNQELLLRRRQAEQASAAKSHFIASMSHEFRSPIASIMGYADLLQTELPDSANPQALQRASWHLLTLVENLLEQARDGDDSVKLNPTRFSLDRLAGDIEALFRNQSTAKGLDFEVNSSPEGIDVECDELRLRQILINLVRSVLISDIATTGSIFGCVIPARVSRPRILRRFSNRSRVSAEEIPPVPGWALRLHTSYSDAWVDRLSSKANQASVVNFESIFPVRGPGTTIRKYVHYPEPCSG